MLNALGCGNFEIEWYIFDGQKNEHVSIEVPPSDEIKEDDVPERLKVFIIKIEAVDAIRETGGARVTIDQPIVITVYDNDGILGMK